MGRGRKKIKASRSKSQENQDRISGLPDDLILRILSFTDIKLAVQTSLLSTRWKDVWKSLHPLTFDRSHFHRVPHFINFVTQFLSHRNPESDISVLNLKCSNVTIQQPFLKKIALYAASHNVQSLDISAYLSKKRSCYKCGGARPLPLSVFSCRSLNHLSVSLETMGHYLRVSNVPKSTWTLPYLTTLVLKKVSFKFCCDSHSTKSADPFSNLVNLKNLKLSECCSDGLETFSVIAPKLETLVVSSMRSRYLCEFAVSAPKLLSFEYLGADVLHMSANDLTCLENVDIKVGYLEVYHQAEFDFEKRRSLVWEIINMFRQLKSGRFVSLNLLIIEAISWGFDLVRNQPSPFSNMESLKIVGCRSRDNITTFPTALITYLCNTSPNCIVSLESEEHFQDS